MRFFLLLIICLFTCLSTLFSSIEANEAKKPLDIKFPFEGVLGKYDLQTLQRGYKVYREVCSSCHAMKRIAFRNLEEIGFSPEEVKALAKQYMVNDGPNDVGERFEREGLPSDYFVPPYPNKQAASAANGGAYPPDLSLIIKARMRGPQYVYSLLTGYTSSTPDENGLYHNPYFPAGKLAMKPPLSDNLVEFEDGRESTMQNASYDVVSFLQWAAEPELEQRKKLGAAVIIITIALTVILYLIKRSVWRRLYIKK